MSSSSLSCDGRKGCSSEVLHACKCVKPVVFLCRKCIGVHISEPRSHIIISIDQGLELLNDSTHSTPEDESFDKLSEIKAELHTYISKIRTFKAEIEKLQIEVLSLVEEKCRICMKYLDMLEDDATSIFLDIRNRISNIPSIDDNILTDFDSKGLAGIIQDYRNIFEINTAQVKKAVQEMITISYIEEVPEIAPQSFLFTCKSDSNVLIKYDLESNQTSEYDLASTLPGCLTSTCMLPDGNVILVGFGKGKSETIYGDTYKFITESATCLKLNDLHFPRVFSRLICHGKYLYAFGGGITANHSLIPVNKAERIDWSSNEWEILNDMKIERICPGSYYIDYKLWIIGGNPIEYPPSMEYYDLRNGKFSIVDKLIISRGSCVAGVIDDRVYIIGEHLQVLNKSNQNIEEKRGMHKDLLFNMSGVIVKDKKIVYASQKENEILEFDPETLSIHKLAEY